MYGGVRMSLELRLEYIGQTASDIQLRLLVTNQDPDRILIPHPEITGLEFADPTGSTAQWYTSLLVSSNWAGLVLNPGESRATTFSVRPTSLARPQRDNNSHYHRWSLGITAGRYEVRYSILVDANYFDGDSHYRFSDVESEARKLSARAWTGKGVSNVVPFEYTPPEASPNGGA